MGLVSVLNAPGAFGDGRVRLEILDPGRRSSWMVCIFHGVFGSASLERGNKYGLLADMIGGAGIPVCTVETSRTRRDRESLDDSGSWVVEAFGGKTYGQELFDHMSALSVLAREFPDRSICLWGFSLGGINALMIAGGAASGVLREERISPPWVPEDRLGAVVVSGSGDSLRPGASLSLSLPVLDSICETKILHEACRSVGGWVRFFWGEADATFDQASSRRLFDLIGTDRKSFSILTGVDHSFRTVNGIPSSEPLEIMAGDVLPYLQGQSGD